MAMDSIQEKNNSQEENKGERYSEEDKKRFLSLLKDFFKDIPSNYIFWEDGNADSLKESMRSLSEKMPTYKEVCEAIMLAVDLKLININEFEKVRDEVLASIKKA